MPLHSKLIRSVVGILPSLHALLSAWIAPSALMAVSISAMLLASPLQAAEIQVSTISDGIATDNRCTLREAIQAANTDTQVDTCAAGNGHDTIVLFFDSDHDMAVAGANEDTNQTGDFDIREDVTIRPENPDVVVTISAQGLDRVFEVFPGASLTLERIRVADGDTIGFGGGIFVQVFDSVLTLQSSLVSNNSSTLFGGGIYSAGTVNLIDSDVRDNDSSFGGGIYMGTSSPLNMTRSLIRVNHATADGGGLHVVVLNAENSTVHNNTANRHGGGIVWRSDNRGAEPSTLTQITVAENHSNEHGGGLYVDGSPTVESYGSTIAWNVADLDENDTGQGGGLFMTSGTFRPKNTIVAGNLDASVGAGGGASVAPDCVGSVDSQGYNLLAAVDASECVISGTSTGNLVGTLAAPIDHDLNCMSNNGGPGQTVKPMDTSPAIDAGDPSGCAGPSGPLTADQRGNLRHWDGPDPDSIATCDMGSVEVGAPSADTIFLDGFETGDTTAWSQGLALTPTPPWMDPESPVSAARRGGGCNPERSR